MAHSCPACGMICYCGLDIDDCLFDFDADVDACTHCDEDGECAYEEEYWEEGFNA